MRAQFIAILLVALLVYQTDACAKSESKCGPACCPKWLKCCNKDLGQCCGKAPGGFPLNVEEPGHGGEPHGPRPVIPKPASQ
ncbi:hypothetical protein AAVH_15356 [Aphelenchoides avenae]|nr:hypothetical protein AAVH_15356 [Aphelenchus avenae]